MGAIDRFWAVLGLTAPAPGPVPDAAEISRDLPPPAGPPLVPQSPELEAERRDRAMAEAVASIIGRVTASPDRIAGAPLKGGRTSLDRADQIFGTSLGWISAPPTYEESWRLIEVDSETLKKVSAPKLLQMMCDLSPEISRAVWDFLRLCNPGWEYSARKPGAKTENPRARAIIDDFILTLNDLYGTIDVVFGKMFLAAFIRGSICLELVLDDAATTAVDLATPDPIAIRFKQVFDPVRKAVWQIGQWVNGKWVNLDLPTIRYVPIDPFPGTPYGRPIAAPALFSSMFMLGLMHDLRRVVAQQGYPRLDVAIDLEALSAIMPADVATDSAKIKAWVDEIIDEVKKAYSRLAPEDAYVHTSVVTINRPVGAVDVQALGAIDGLFKALERMCVRALKTMPLMMGLAEGMSEANANRQWEITAAGIKSIQHYGEAIIGRLLEVTCQAQGEQAVVEFRFSELRTAELMRDAQVKQLEILNARDMYEAGAIDIDEMAELICGHKAVARKPITYVGRVAMTSPNGGQSPDPAPDEQRVAPGGEHLNGLRETARNGHSTGTTLTKDRILRWVREEFRDDL
jgi:hypothetical protein